LSETLTRVYKLSLTITLLAICIFVGMDFIKALIRIGRKRFGGATANKSRGPYE
jgi:hypothetical protein